jgi:hypothetical protein
MKLILVLSAALFLSVSIFSQTKLVLEDKTLTINPITDSLLQQKLMDNNIELVSLVDYRKKM